MARHLILLLLSALLVPETTAFRKDVSLDVAELDIAKIDDFKTDVAETVEVEVDASEEDETHPDFSGHYILDRVEGDPDHAAYNAGVSWAQRQAAWAASYGAGTLTVDLTQRGNHFDIRSSTPLGSSRVQFDVGGGRQTATASDGGNFDIDPRW